MDVEELLGHTHSLKIVRQGPHGAFLAIDAEDDDPHAPTLLLPGADIPEGAADGDFVDVFVYRDSEDRPIATTLVPLLELDEVAFLTVTDVTRIGAFVDWGLPKELLVPFREQTRSDLQPGDRHPIGLMLDDTGRLAGTMRVRELLSDAPSTVKRGEWIAGEAFRNEPEIGLFVILERRFLGLVPASEPHRLLRGEAASFRVTNITADGKVELSLRKLIHEELESDADLILQALARPNATRVGDDTSPERIRALFGISKKAFKRAVGRLLKQGDVQIDELGFVVPISRGGRGRLRD
jgi:predicted RNA-binding protein (virulence factor B family)